MTGLKKSYSRSILRLLEIPHGIIIIIKLLLLLQLLPYATAQTGTVLPPPSPYPFNPKFSPSMAIILVVLVSAFFFMGFFSVYIRQCAERRLVRSFREEFVGGGGGGRRSRRAAARGLDPAVIETFPTFVYSEVKGLKIGKGSLECAVCLNEFEDDETLRLLPKCNHVFHPACIDAWLGSHTTCPVCRAHLVPKPGDVVYATTLVQDSEGESGHRPDTDDAQNQVMIRVADDDLIEPSDVIDPNEVTNQNRPPRIRTTRGRITGKFPRSHSTGHSLVQPGENCERFTLRLPEEVRNQIVNTSLNRTKSCVAFPRVRSSRTGYRSSSGGGKNYMSYERFDRDTRWGFSMTPPFFSRTGSARSPKLAAGDAATSTSTPFNLFKSVKSPFDRLFLPVDNVGERSSDRLRPDSQL